MLVPVALVALIATLAQGSGKAETPLAVWSAPATLGCTLPSGPAVVFPSRSPFVASGPGTIVWNGSPAGCRSRGEVSVSALGAADLPVGSARVPGSALGLSASQAVAGTGSGRVIAAVHLAGGTGGVVETLDGRPLGPPRRLGGPAGPIASASSYIGDAALAGLFAAPRRGAAVVSLSVQRSAAGHLGKPIALTRDAATVSAVSVNLDYRGDALVAWQQHGAIYAREVRVTGALGPIQRVGPSSPHPALATSISDDGRAMIAWLSQPPGRGPTVVYLSISGPLVNFGQPRVVENFTQPAGTQLPGGSLRLVRLSSESVMLAWTGMAAGRYVVRTAPVGLGGLRPTTTISDPTEDAILAGLATGPHDEALAIWLAGPRAAPSSQAVVVARGFIAGRGATIFDRPEEVAPPGPNASPAIALDPANDRAVAAWRAGGTVRYAVRTTGARGL